MKQTKNKKKALTQLPVFSSSPRSKPEELPKTYKINKKRLKEWKINELTKNKKQKRLTRLFVFSSSPRSKPEKLPKTYKNSKKILKKRLKFKRIKQTKKRKSLRTQVTWPVFSKIQLPSRRNELPKNLWKESWISKK